MFIGSRIIFASTITYHSDTLVGEHGGAHKLRNLRADRWPIGDRGQIGDQVVADDEQAGQLNAIRKRRTDRQMADALDEVEQDHHRQKEEQKQLHALLVKVAKVQIDGEL